MSLQKGTISVSLVEKEYFKTQPLSRVSQAFREWVEELDSDHRALVMEDMRNIYNMQPGRNVGVAAAAELLAVYVAAKEGWLNEKVKR